MDGVTDFGDFGKQHGSAGADQQVVSWPNTRTPVPLGQWTEGPQPLPIHETLNVAVVDFDRDGQLDIAAGTIKEGLDVWTGDGGYTWTLRMDKPQTGVVWSDVAWGQIDNFSDLDLVAAGDGVGLRAWSLAEWCSIRPASSKRSTCWRNGVSAWART